MVSWVWNGPSMPHCAIWWRRSLFFRGRGGLCLPPQAAWSFGVLSGDTHVNVSVLTCDANSGTLFGKGETLGLIGKAPGDWFNLPPQRC